MRFGMFGLAAGDRDPVPLSMEDSIGSDTTTSSHCSDEESKEPYTPPAKRACSRPDSIEKGSSKQSNEKQDTLLEASWLGSLDAVDMVDTAAHSFHIDHDSFASALQAFDSPGFQPSSNLQDATMEDDLLWQLVAPEHGSSDDTADWLSSTPNSLPSTPSTDTLVEFPRGPSGGGVHNRKEWAAWEDEAIRAGVAELGMRWRAIAARLSGRSDDAVRNRWARLHASSNAGNCPANKSGAPSRQKREGAAETRHSWTAAEDAVIMASVAECGRRWNRIAARLPRRTEHAIRNRWHRLQMQVLDKAKVEAEKGISNNPADKGVFPPKDTFKKRALDETLPATDDDKLLSIAEL